MSAQDDREDLLNSTLDAYQESTGTLPSEDQMPEIVNVVDNYMEGGNGYTQR